MEFVKDLNWEHKKSVKDLVKEFSKVGYQSIELERAGKIFVKMKEDNAKVFLTFTSNMVTSGLRGFFAQLIRLGIVGTIVTTVGSIEEDIMKAEGDKFPITSFNADDEKLMIEGINRIGNLGIDNKTYMKFEDRMGKILKTLYEKKKRWTPSDMFKEIGLMLDDEDSILYQAAKNDVKVYCPAITDGAFGFHLYLFQEKNKDFIVDVVEDFGSIIKRYSSKDKKGTISLGGSISKHHALIACLMSGGLDYAVYMTTASPMSGSLSGATTEEAKSWGKIKDSSNAATVIGDVTITFPLAMMYALDVLKEKGLISS